MSSQGQGCDVMCDSIVAGFCIVGAQCCRKLALAHHVHGDPFVSRGSNRHVAGSTAMLFRCDGSCLRGSLHDVAFQFFVVHVQFRVHQGNRSHLLCVVHPCFLENFDINDFSSRGWRKSVLMRKGAGQCIEFHDAFVGDASLKMFKVRS